MTPKAQAAKTRAAATTGGVQIQRTYLTVRSRKRFGSRTWKRRKKGLKPSAFSSAARWRAPRAFASRVRFFSATVWARRSIDRSISSYSRTRDISTGSRGNRAWYSAWTSASVRVPSKSGDQAPLVVLEVVVLRGLRVLDHPLDLAHLHDPADDERPRGWRGGCLPCRAAPRGRRRLPRAAWRPATSRAAPGGSREHGPDLVPEVPDGLAEERRDDAARPDPDLRRCRACPS